LPARTPGQESKKLLEGPTSDCAERAERLGLKKKKGLKGRRERQNQKKNSAAFQQYNPVARRTGGLSEGARKLSRKNKEWGGDPQSCGRP